MRSAEECQSLLRKAVSDGIIESAKQKRMDWAIADIGRYVMLTFHSGDTVIHGSDIQTALNNATEYVLSLYPKENAMLTCTCGRWEKRWDGWYGTDNNVTLVPWTKHKICPDCGDILDDILVEDKEEKKTMTTDDAKCKPKEFQFSYADCFRILREAVGTGLIMDWDYKCAHVKKVRVWHSIGDNNMRIFYDDKDHAKGDIGILNEAARYVLGLRKQDTRTMTAQECVKEIGDALYVIDPYTFVDDGKDQVPTLSLWFSARDRKDGFVFIMEPTETIEGFLRRCVEYVRSKKTT